MDSTLYTREMDNSYYGYAPNLGANLAAAIGFGILLLFQIFFGLKYRQWWFGITIVIFLICEVIGYIARVLAHSNPDVWATFMVQIIVLTFAPSFLMAGIYSLPAKYGVIYGQKTSPMRPMWYTYIFVTVDIFAILLQGGGGGIAASSNGNNSLGTNIMIAGLALQVVSMLFFAGLCLHFIHKVCQQKRKYSSTSTAIDDGFDPRYQHIRNRKMFIPLVYAIFVSFTLIFIRCVFRTVELGMGWGNTLMDHEIYFLILETLMVFLGVIPITVVHPGMAFSKLRIKMHKKEGLSST